jgi:hypothetical protein
MLLLHIICLKYQQLQYFCIIKTVKRMKKQLLLLTAGGMLAFASCKNEAPVADAGASQAQIDSIVNARVEEIRAELMAQNDSLINALAQWKADSMIAAMKGAKPTASKPAAKPKAKPDMQGTNNTATTGTTTTSTSNSPIKSNSDQKGGLKGIKDNADKK